MGKMAMDRSQSAYVDTSLQDELARGNRALASIAPVIAHFLNDNGPSLITDAIVAQLRGMLNHIAQQLLPKSETASKGYSENLAEIMARLTNDVPLIEHLYAVALEGQITESLEQRAAVDPVLSPLMQELIASTRPETAELAMTALSSQARFCQSQRRMELPLGELPYEIFSSVLHHLEEFKPGVDPLNAAAKLQEGFDEGASRLGLMARLCANLQGGAIAALDLGHAGFALFSSAAASLTQQDRAAVVFACHEGQAARLALTLRTAGLNADAIDAQLGVLGSRTALSPGIASIAALPQESAFDTLRTMGRTLGNDS
ncbi:MAG: hypothetical protein AAGI28_08090 [Pseudomonadota bacterium]